MIRLPFAPVAQLLNRSDEPWPSQLGVDWNYIKGWQRNGLTVRAADRIANRLGLHPVNIWGDAFLEPSDRWKTSKSRKKARKS